MSGVPKKQLARLIAAFPAATIDEDMLSEWLKKMGRYQPSITTKAVDLLIENSRFFPSIAEFVEMAKSETLKQKHAQSLERKHNCKECEGGFIEMGRDDENYESVKPCRYCLPDTYENWKAGAYEMGRI